MSAFSSVLCVLPRVLASAVSGIACGARRIEAVATIRRGCCRAAFDDDAAMLCRSSAAVAVLLVDWITSGASTRRAIARRAIGAADCGASAEGKSATASRSAVSDAHGGRRVLILLTVDSFSEAHRQADRLRVALERRRLLPACIGIAFADASGSREPARLLRLATINKDTAKKSGGNAVFPPEESPTASAPLVASHALPVGLAVNAAAARLSADVPPVERRNHPSECMCALCLQDVRQAADAAQVQTLGLFDDMGQIRRRLRDVRESLLNTADDISTICDCISHHGAGPTQ